VGSVILFVVMICVVVAVCMILNFMRLMSCRATLVHEGTLHF
jgi:hypothetical protein